MKKILGFDTETTGIINFKADLMDATQPRIVQLAAELYDEEGNVLRTLSAIIKPEGFDSIPDGAFQAHGISIERCHAEGRPMPDVLAEFNDLKAEADTRFAYNIPFDKKMLAREAGYFGIAHDSTGVDSYCVMKMCTPIVNMPPTAKMKSAGFGYKPKNPKLIEAYRHFFQKEFDAHDALNDVRAAKDIFFLIKKDFPDNFKAEPVKVFIPREEFEAQKLKREDAMRPAPNGHGEDAANIADLSNVAGEAF